MKRINKSPSKTPYNSSLKTMKSSPHQTTIISLGGSMIIPGEIDIQFLTHFKELIVEYIKTHRVILVCGGGQVCRKYQEAAQKLSPLSNRDMDWIGIMATRLNAELLRVIFQDYAYSRVIYNPEERLDFASIKKNLIIAAGYEPGWSTDYDAVLLAKQVQAAQVINISNIDYVYTKDPKQFKDAKKIEKISWREFKQLVGGEFTPGMHAPFDPMASKIASQEGIKVIIVDGKKIDNLKLLLQGKAFKGTVIG